MRCFQFINRQYTGIPCTWISYYFSKFLVFYSVLSLLIQCFSCDVITFKDTLICELQQSVTTNNYHNVISRFRIICI